MSQIILPELGEGVEEGELVRWLVNVGDKVLHDQPIAELLTDKAAVEVPSPIDGVVAELRFKEGDTIRVGQVMVVLEGALTSPAPKAASEHSGAKSKPTGAASTAVAGSSRAAVDQTWVRSNQNVGASGVEIYPSVSLPQVLASPATRRLSRELGVNINRVKGSGPGSRVLREDVERAAQSSGISESSSSDLTSGISGHQGLPLFDLKWTRLNDPSGREVKREPLRGIRKKISENMQKAKWTIPHFTLCDEFDASQLIRAKEQLALKFPETKITFLPFVMKALVAAAKEFPAINASIDDVAHEIVYRNYFDFGFAADTPHGLMVPVIRKVNEKSVVVLAQEIVALADRARRGEATREELVGSTVTITNIGAVRGLHATPIINHPEVCIVGMYRMTQRPVWVKDRFEPRPLMNITLTCDHRLIDGAVAARVLSFFLKLLESDEFLNQWVEVK